VHLFSLVVLKARSQALMNLRHHARVFLCEADALATWDKIRSLLSNDEANRNSANRCVNAHFAGAHADILLC
jgi:hypothetical protein